MRNARRFRPTTFGSGQIVSVIEVGFPARFLRRGFWLYVWEVNPGPGQELVYYVGRTGDSSSPNAQSPFVRMGQHLGSSDNSNMLKKHILSTTGLKPDCCHSFRLLAHGPILREATNMKRHVPRRNRMAALECALAEDLREAGYNVANDVRCRHEVDDSLRAEVRRAFSKSLARLRRQLPHPRRCAQF
ncbi:MAG: hypothetical protein FD180_387 [Planctomycetota bacterium]|nr:MAG: hypothetical protein FD180_387 [Planctomycetota bacterium]